MGFIRNLFSFIVITFLVILVITIVSGSWLVNWLSDASTSLGTFWDTIGAIFNLFGIGG